MRPGDGCRFECRSLISGKAMKVRSHLLEYTGDRLRRRSDTASSEFRMTMLVPTTLKCMMSDPTARSVVSKRIAKGRLTFTHQYPCSSGHMFPIQTTLEFAACFQLWAASSGQAEEREDVVSAIESRRQGAKSQARELLRRSSMSEV